jgi:hypothetical protein
MEFNIDNVGAMFWEHSIELGQGDFCGRRFKNRGKTWSFKNCSERPVVGGLSGFEVGCCRGLYVRSQG